MVLLHRNIRSLSRTSLLTPLVAAAVLLAGGCESDDGPSGPDLTTVASVVVSPAQATVDNGFLQQFSAVVTNAEGDAITTTVAWSVGDADLGSIGQNGLFTAGVTAPLIGSVVATAGGVSDTVAVTVEQADIFFVTHLLSVFQGSCALAGCHSSTSQSGGLKLSSYSELMAGTSNNGPVVTPGDPANSYIIRKLMGTAPGSRMPLSGSVPQSWINQLWIWIAQSAPDNAGR